MYSCEDCAIWWEEFKPVIEDLSADVDEPVEEEPANTKAG
jgi:hypothetical protein